MPQMAPMNWLSLFMYFTLILMFINILNYYMMMPSKKINIHKFLLKFNWKW